MEKIIEYRNLRNIVHRLYCDDCEKEMYFTGQVYTTYPEEYVYKCPICNNLKSVHKFYPWNEIIGDEVICGPQGQEVCVSL